MEIEVVVAREFYNLPKDVIWSMGDKSFTMEFEDGVITTNTKASIFSWYLGSVHRLFPKTPLLMKHHIGDEIFTKNTHIKVLSDIISDAKDTYGDKVDIEYLKELAYLITNEIYNDFTTKLKPYVSTISALDFVNVIQNEKIAEANNRAKPSQDSIDETYTRVKNALMDPNETGLLRNTIGRMAKSGLVSMGQILQCVSLRGYVTDIDSNIFPDPIMRNYTQGLEKLADSMKESRSASKALKFAAEKISDTEYFSRELQLMTSIISRIHKGDCGSKEYVSFEVGAGDLDKIVGKYYIEDNGKLNEVTSRDRHLIGKKIKLRSPIKCNHPDSYGICSTCMGKLSDSIPRDTNIGHVSATVLGEKISQNVMSTKHLDGTSKVDEFVLDEFDSKFIKVVNEVSKYSGADEEVTVIKLADNLIGKKVKMTLGSRQARNLSDIDYHDLKNISVPTIGKLKEVIIEVETETPSIPVTVPVSMGSRYSWLTMEALSYIKESGYKLDERGDYVIDLTDWPMSKPLFQLPLKHTDMTQYMRQVKTLVMNSRKTAKAKATTPDDFLLNFYSLVISKLNINIAHLEIIVLASLVRNLDTSDHRLPAIASEGTLSSYKENMKLRSMGPSMAYQAQGKEMMAERSFIYTKRPDSAYDNILVPYPTHNPRE